MSVVVPAFNEERAIARTLQDVPDIVDHIVVVDDASSDTTAQRAIALKSNSSRRAVEIVSHEANRGVGAAIITGYRRALACNLDVAVVMAGDGQMDPADLPRLLDPIAAGQADYCKGNRFLHRDVWRVMPPSRIVGNLVLSLATRVTSGYWQIFDSQCGYTAISRNALERLELDRVFSRYGYPNDVLARLHAVDIRVVDVPVRPVYGANWKSGIKLSTVVYPVAFVLLRSWMTRIATETQTRLRPVRFFAPDHSSQFWPESPGTSQSADQPTP